MGQITAISKDDPRIEEPPPPALLEDEDAIDDELEADLAAALDDDSNEAAERQAWVTDRTLPTTTVVAKVGRERVRFLMQQEFESALAPWGNSASSEHARSPEPTGADRVRASLTALKGALRMLGSRDRAGSRAYLQTRCDTLASKLALIDGLGRWLEGPAAYDLIDRYVATRNACAVARAAMLNASRADVLASRAELDLCEADERQIDREMAAIKDRLAFPHRSIVEPAIVEEARNATKYIADNANANRAMITHRALDNGRDATPEEAHLWICFEPASGGELFDLRWARFVAAHPEAAT